MFHKSPQFYDAIYSFKDYASEAAKLESLIGQHGESGGRTLLDVACGTGAHIEFLKARYEVEGLDLDAGLLEYARQKHAGLLFHQGDMTAFDLGRTYDVVTCLFSSIGYVKSVGGLYAAIAAMARHVKPGGVLVVEPWFTPERAVAGMVSALFVDKAELKIARMNITTIEGTVSTLNFRYMVGTPAGIDSFEEKHELGLFTRHQQEDAFRMSGLQVLYDEEGLSGRGLYIGKKPLGESMM